MLEQVREAALVVVLEHAPGVDDEPELGAGARLGVGADDVRQPVVEHAAARRRVGRERIHEDRSCGDGGGWSHDRRRVWADARAGAQNRQRGERGQGETARRLHEGTHRECVANLERGPCRVDIGGE